MKRREFIKIVGLGSLIPPSLYFGELSKAWAIAPEMRPIPSTGEMIPAIGLGSSRTFNVGRSATMRKQCTEVIKTFFDMGGTVIDCSPMYGTSEEVIGHALKNIKPRPKVMSTTKVWSDDLNEGKEQFQSALKYWGESPIDIYQIHNLLNWKEHLKVLKKYKAEGKIRYLGITTSHGRRLEDLKDIMKKEKLDFVQFTYNLNERWNDGDMFKIAQDRGIATIINRPFERGDLFDKVSGMKLPEWAKEMGCENWAQYFLKWVISKPGVTCAIPATRQVAHMRENMGALQGPMPDEKMRARMLGYYQSL